MCIERSADSFFIDVLYDHWVYCVLLYCCVLLLVLLYRLFFTMNVFAEEMTNLTTNRSSELRFS